VQGGSSSVATSGVVVAAQFWEQGFMELFMKLQGSLR
jgi:hypothetical protein